MKATLPRRVEALEARVPLRRNDGGPMIVILEAGADEHSPFRHWYDQHGQPHEPIVIAEDPRPGPTPAEEPLVVCGAAEDSYDYGDDREDGLE